MSEHQATTTVGALPPPAETTTGLPGVLTRTVWLGWLVSLAVGALYVLRDGPWKLGGLLAVDGLTVVMWVTATFLSGIVHSYARRYMAGGNAVDRFFRRIFAFTLVVSVLVAAANLAIFVAAWVTMGLLMAGLIGHVQGWPEAQAAASLARRSFLASSGALAVAVVTLWYYTGATTLSGIAAGVQTVPTPIVLVTAGAIVLAAAIQSALLPFHTWLLASMTAPTPASALMHAGFVNAGGILLVRFAPVVTGDTGFLFAVAVLGAISALGGKLMKTVRTDIKGQLGCSTVGQMGFMILQAGLGFFAAAVTHLVLHGFYKAYRFLGAGEQVAHEHPKQRAPEHTPGLLDGVVILATGLVGGLVFATLTGKGTPLGSGLLLTLLVVLTVLLAARTVVGRASLPAPLRYGAVPLVAIPAIAVYATVYRTIDGLLAGLPALGQPVPLSPGHALLTAAFVVTFLAIERGVYRHSDRLYVALLNATEPPATTQLTDTEAYDEY
jgi:NAD(P)H-quinone oxidoreductase subunit 5